MISFSLKERGEVGTLENTCTWAPFFFGFPSRVTTHLQGRPSARSGPADFFDTP